MDYLENINIIDDLENLEFFIKFQEIRYQNLATKVENIINRFIHYWMEINRLPEDGYVYCGKYEDYRLGILNESLTKKELENYHSFFKKLKNLYVEWQAKDYPTLGFAEDDKEEIYTKKGLRVRNNVHKQLAEIFDKEGIYYQYEKPKYLKDGRVVYPPFTFLNTGLHYEIYWDVFQFGRSIEEYDVSLERMEAYMSNGILEGRNLIASFDVPGYEIDEELVKLDIELLIKTPSMVLGGRRVKNRSY